MPIFEFRCKKCDYTFEKFTPGRTGNGGAGPTCPRCGRAGTEKVFSVFASQGGCSSTSSFKKHGSGGFS